MPDCCTHRCRQGRDCPARLAAEYDRAARRLLLPTLVLTLALALFVGWLTTRAIAGAAHDVVNAHEWRM